MAEENGIASGFVGMFNAFVDPAGLAKRVQAKLFWVGPVITVTIILMVVGYLMKPFTIGSVSVPPEGMRFQARIGLPLSLNCSSLSVRS